LEIAKDPKIYEIKILDLLSEADELCQNNNPLYLISAVEKNTGCFKHQF